MFDVTLFSNFKASPVIMDEVGLFCCNSSQVGKWHEACLNAHDPCTLGEVRAGMDGKD